MGTRQGARDQVRQHREHVADDMEPHRTFKRQVVERRTTNYANLPPLALQKLNLSGGDGLDVEVYEDRVVIRPQSE